MFFNHSLSIFSTNQAAAAKVKSSKSEQNTAELNMVATYISFSTLKHSIDRNLVLAKDIYNKLEGDEATTDKNEDVQYQNLVKAYDNIVQVSTLLRLCPRTSSSILSFITYNGSSKSMIELGCYPRVVRSRCRHEVIVRS